ncbi:MAG: 50S ribosomal protein L10 [Thermoprotei archaeon]|nr:MAG: 50S ribosomal protein L10 [Thermoprotei archaeon]
MKGSSKAGLIRTLRRLEKARATVKRVVRPALIKKQATVEEIKGLLKKFKVIGIISLEGVPASQYKRMRRKLEEYGFIKVYKNNLFLRAAEEVGLAGLEELKQYLTGTNAFMFTNLNAFELALLLDKVEERRFAKPGDEATEDIYLPQGPTGIPPGPMLSVFGKLRVPTQVREGIIWINKEVRVAKAGDTISPELASLLRKLGLKVITVKLSLKAAWDEGLVIPAEKLRVDLGEVRDELATAVLIARELATEAALPVPDIVANVLMRAIMRAIAVSVEAGFVTKETAPMVLSHAIGRAQALALAIKERNPEIDLGVVAQPAQPSPAAAPSEEEGGEEEEKKEEVSEEEIAEGIASLFG